MHVKAKLNSYEKLAFSVTLTAPVEDWRAAMKQLEESTRSGVAWPLSGLATCINQMLSDLDKTHADVLIREPVLPTPRTPTLAEYEARHEHPDDRSGSSS